MINYEVLFAWTALTVIGCFVIEQFLKKFYQTIAHDRRRYITKNILKSFLLTILALYSGPMMWSFIVNNVIDNTFIHTTGFMYVKLSLLKTNSFLGARFLLNRNNAKEDNQRAHLASYSLWIYVLSIIVNWSYQIFVIVSSMNDCMRTLHQNIVAIGSVWPSWSAAIVWKSDIWTDILSLFQNMGTLASIFGYCGIIYFIVQDDIDLMKKLKMETALSKLKN